MQIKQCPQCKQYFPADKQEILCRVCRNKEPELNVDALKDLFGMFDKEEEE